MPDLTLTYSVDSGSYSAASDHNTGVVFEFSGNADQLKRFLFRYTRSKHRGSAGHPPSQVRSQLDSGLWAAVQLT